MGHDADTRTLERYYLDLTPTTNLTALTLGESPEARAEEMALSNAPLAIEVLTPEVVKRCHGAALNALVRKMIERDENYPTGGSEKDQKNYRRLVSRAAADTLLAEEVQKRRREMTSVQYQKRVRSINLSYVMDKVLMEANSRLKVIASGGSEVAVQGMNSEGLFEENGVEEEPEEDLDHQFTSDKLTIIKSIDEPGDGTSKGDEEVPYEAAAKLFMDILFHNRLSEHEDLVNNPAPCKLCIEDETVEQKHKVDSR